MAARDVTEARCDYQAGTILTHNAIEFCCDEGDAWLVGDLSKGLARHFHATDDQIVLGHKTRTRAGTIPADRSSSVSHHSGARRMAAILPPPRCYLEQSLLDRKSGAIGMVCRRLGCVVLGVQVARNLCELQLGRVSKENGRESLTTSPSAGLNLAVRRRDPEVG